MTPAQQAGLALSTALANNSGKPIMLLLSGGSAFDVLTYVADVNLSPLCTLTMLDERYSTDNNVNNFAQFAQTSFYRKAHKKGCNFIDTRIHLSETREHLTQRFQEQLYNFKYTHPTGKIIIVQGIGPDGHTAGILPFENKKLFHQLFENTWWAVSYDAGSKNKYPLRITTTITFLKKEVDFSVVYAVGHEKKQILQTLCTKPNSIPYHNFPAGIIWHMKKVHIFSDVIECSYQNND